MRNVLREYENLIHSVVLRICRKSSKSHQYAAKSLFHDDLFFALHTSVQISLAMIIRKRIKVYNFFGNAGRENKRERKKSQGVSSGRWLKMYLCYALGRPFSIFTFCLFALVAQSICKRYSERSQSSV